MFYVNPLVRISPEPESRIHVFPDIRKAAFTFPFFYGFANLLIRTFARRHAAYSVVLRLGV